MHLKPESSRPCRINTVVGGVRGNKKRTETCKLYGWPNDPRYWDSRCARRHNEPEPEPDIYLLQTQTASNLLIRPSEPQFAQPRRI
jgi:hypothetical protein